VSLSFISCNLFFNFYSFKDPPLLPNSQSELGRRRDYFYKVKEDSSPLGNNREVLLLHKGSAYGG